MHDTIAKRSFARLSKPAGLGTGPVPIEPYVSPEWYELERKNVFGRAWLCMGRVEEFPEQNFFRTRSIEVCNVEVLLTRDKTDTIRAFHNVCAHRANLLVLEPEGRASRFSCNYHRWTYDNKGNCVNVPDQENFFDLDLKDCALKSIACEVWEGWIFINLQPRPEVSLEEFLGAFGTAFRDLPLPAIETPVVIVSNLKANWKVIADAFAEAYHVPALHPNTLSSTFSTADNPWSRPVSFSVYDSHRSFSTYGNPDFVPSETALVERFAYGADAVGNVLGSGDEGEAAKIAAHPAINPTGARDWANDVAWLFPHFQIDFAPSGFWTHEFWPTSVNTTRWVAKVYIPKATTVQQRLQQEHHIARFSDVLVEDVANTQRQQIAMETGAQTHMFLQDGEAMIRHSYEVLKTWIEAKSAKDALAAL